MSKFCSLVSLALLLYVPCAVSQQPPRAAAATGAAGRGRGSVTAEVTGDAKAGEAFFNGAGGCTACHSVTGDLQGVGSRMNPTILQGRMVYPRGSGGYGAATTPQGAKPDTPLIAAITGPDGRTVQGNVLAISDFIVTIKQADGTRRTFTRDGDSPKVVVTDPLQAHIDLLLTLTDKTMHDLTAYLVTLK